MKDNTVRTGVNYNDSKMTVIIRCTSCNTKFAVNKTDLGDSATPKFHCSKCDNVFTVNMEDANSTSELPKPSEEHQSQFEFEFQIPEDPVTITGLDPLPESNFSEDEEKIELSTPTYSGSVIADDAFEPISGSDLEPDIFGQVSNTPQPANQDIPQIQTAMAIPPIEEPMGYDSLRTSKLMQSHEPPPTSVPKGESFFSRLKSSPSPRILFYALIALLSLPVITYQWVVSSPSSADKLFSHFKNSSVQLPPDELFIRSSFIKRIHLDTGEPVSVISGIIRNNSSYNLKKILVEGILYSSQGAVVKKKNIDVSASLGRSRIQSLTVELLEDLQNNATGRNFMLRSGQENEFTLVVPEGTAANDIHFYAARIYSVAY